MIRGTSSLCLRKIRTYEFRIFLLSLFVISVRRVTFSVQTSKRALSTANMSKTFKPVTHVIFDMDGLLLDTVPCYRKIDEVLMGKYGKEVPDDLSMHLAGFTDQDCAKKIVEICQLPITPKEYELEIRNHTYLLKDVTLLPGAERLIKHLSDNNIPIAIATSSSSDSVEIKTANHKELFTLFHHMVMGSTDPEVKHGKPAPDIFLICAARFPDKPNPEQCLVFEDASSGVTAAIDAGMQVVLVPDEKLEEEHRKKATVVLDSLVDFKPECFGLPSFA